MKKLIPFLLLFISAFANEGEISHILTPRGGSDPHTDNKNIVRQFYEAFQENNPAKMHDYLTSNPQVTDKTTPYDAPYSKYDAFSKNWKVRSNALHEAIPDFKLHIIKTIAEGNQVLAHIKIQGIQRGPFLGVEPTNKMLIIKIFSLFTIENGKISHVSEMWNELGVMKQMGYIAL